MKQKRIAVITMARDDEFFLTRWIEYYGKLFGNKNLYIYLDGMDQTPPKNATGVNITQFPHTPMSRVAGDKYRIDLLSDLANKLMNKYDIVIGCDSDEFLIVDPKVNKTLGEYLSGLNIKTSVSGLGLDIGQNMNCESELDTTRPMLAQRKYALISTRYTKPVVLASRARWGRGFHRVKHHTFHIDKNLYLLHFGAVDMNMLLTKAEKRGVDWVNHLRRRGNGTINATTTMRAHGARIITIARIMQRIFRPLYAIGKPGMLGIKWVVKIPKRFIESGV